MLLTCSLTPSLLLLLLLLMMMMMMMVVVECFTWQYTQLMSC